MLKQALAALLLALDADADVRLDDVNRLDDVDEMDAVELAASDDPYGDVDVDVDQEGPPPRRGGSTHRRT
jgi:hypothetical protein